MKSAIVVVMRCCWVKRSKARGWGVGWWCHQYTKYADSLSQWEHKGSVFNLFHAETKFQKSAFTGTAFTESMWMIGQNDAKRAFYVDGPSRLSGVIKFIEWGINSSWLFIRSKVEHHVCSVCCVCGCMCAYSCAFRYGGFSKAVDFTEALLLKWNIMSARVLKLI